MADGSNPMDEIKLTQDTTSTSSEYIKYLKSIDETTRQILQRATTTSQSDARNQTPGKGEYKHVSRRKSRFGSESDKEQLGDFVDEFERAVFEGLVGSDFKKKIGLSMNAVADAVGVDLKNLQGTLGRHLGKQAVGAFKASSLGKELMSEFDKRKDKLFSGLVSRFKQGALAYDQVHGRTTRNAEGFDESNTINDMKASYAKRSASSYSADPDSSNLSESASSNSASSISATSVSQLDVIIAHLDVIENIMLGEKGDYDTAKSALDDLIKQQTDTAERIEEAVKAQSDAVTETALTVPEDVSGDKLDFIGQQLRDGLDGLTGKFQRFKGGLTDAFGQGGIKGAKGFLSQSASSIATKLGGLFTKGGAGAAKGALSLAGGAGSAAAGGTAAGAVLSGVATAAGPLLTVLPQVAIAAAAVYVGMKLLGPAIEGTKELLEGIGKSANRDKESRKRNLELAEERLREDVKTLVKAPFDILQAAADKLYDAWDNNIRTINQTQGYNKSDLQTLMAQYGERLRDEDLSSVVGGSDIIGNLSKVLDSGLSGAIAEEFAYIATKLNAAIPTQDFFSYADEYVTIAGNAMAAGKSQAEAIAEANAQLEAFAGNILYASRELTGGFTTGLKDAESLFKDSVEIAQAAKTNNSTIISGVLASVSAVVGAIAPDLASEIVGAVTSAATGGNSAELVALRSLAGINASNTEFLRSFANDPQGVFAAVFEGLAEKQNMSNDAYMEVAEGLSSLFGLSMDALTRVDFNYLADSIRNMDVNNASLSENLELLASGESTTNAEMHRLAQVNEYMVNEGLALVLDNEAARSIQEHMWQEQIAREIMEAEYGVNLKGDALSFLEGIKSTINNILSFLNPFSWLANKIANVVQTAAEGEAHEQDIYQTLLLGKVGNGNAQSLFELTTRNQNLNLTDSYVSLLGGISAYETTKAIGNLVHSLNPANAGTTLGDLRDATKSAFRSAILSGITTSFDNFGKRSAYSWGTISKSEARALASLQSSGTSLSSSTAVTQMSSSTAAAQGVTSRIDEMIGSMETYIKENEDATYDKWAATAGQYGISNLSKALEEAGYSESQLESQFQNESTKKAAEKEADRKKNEDDFWNKTREYQRILVEERQPAIVTELQTVSKYLKDIEVDLSSFYDDWVDYFVKHSAYNKAYDFPDINKIKQDENSTVSESVYALAEALTGADLRDPQVQTNALLSQILIVINAIMQQNNQSSTGLSLPDTYSALAMGMFKNV